MFDNFDFTLLDDPQFKEDSVREELISPLLKALGYSASGPYKIFRSKSLTHPFVYIGTKKNEVKIIPDYFISVNDEHRWVLDAKAPWENILSGKNVEQAFSYAIHPDVRAFKYALCNGHMLVVFDVRKIEPILTIKLENISAHLKDLEKTLSPTSFIDPSLLNYKPDFGLYLLKLGLSDNTNQHFVPIGLPFIAKVEENLYSAVVNMEFGDEWYCISFDFDEERYRELLSETPNGISQIIENGLKKQPFKVFLGEQAPVLCVEAILSDTVQLSEKEDFCPLIVKKFKAL